MGLFVIIGVCIYFAISSFAAIALCRAAKRDKREVNKLKLVKSLVATFLFFPIQFMLEALGSAKSN